MSAHVNLIKLTAKLYECRDTARRVSGNSYRNFLLPTIAGIQAIAAEKKLTPLKAGMLLANECAKESDGIGMMWAMAAVVEITEPDELTPQ